MDLLLNTHALLWVETNSPRLGQEARRAILHPRNQVFVSAVTAWEIAVKVALGRLNTPANMAEWLPKDIEQRQFSPLAISLQHAATVELLPPIIETLSTACSSHKQPSKG